MNNSFFIDNEIFRLALYNFPDSAWSIIVTFVFPMMILPMCGGLHLTGTPQDILQTLVSGGHSHQTSQLLQSFQTIC